MENLNRFLRRIATQAIEKAFAGDLSSIEAHLPAEVMQSQHSHYQCNTPLRLGKVLKKAPREVASRIAEQLCHDCIDKVEIAGPGFINIALKPAFLSKQLGEMLADERLGVPLPENPQKVIVEFSSPNVAKELHVGHLRSTIIGDCLARLLEFLGHNVLRLNHIGDWGTQFGMLIAFIREQGGLAGADLPTLMKWYKAAKVKFDADPEFKKVAQEAVVGLQGGEDEALSIWKQICDISRTGYEEVYDLLDVKIQERGESFYNPRLGPLVEQLLEEGKAGIDQGAVCIFVPGYEIPVMIRKSDGGFNYATTDFAAIVQRSEEEMADRVIHVVDAGQRLHFEMVFKAAEQVGLYDPKKTHFEHVPFGVVLGGDGKKFKTRSGETEKLIDLLNRAIEKAGELLAERELNEEDAKILGIDAVKYADLSNQRTKDYVFSYERMLKFEGNTAAFLLYAYVRVQGIKRKVGKKIEDLQAVIHLEHPTEIALGLHLRQFGETLHLMERDLLPHRLTDYLYELAEKFHAFFRDCHVQGTPQEGSRLLVCELTARVMKQGLELLGLKTLDRM